MTNDKQSVAIIGGGLAGLAAAVALAGRELKVELFEAKRRLGGRAGSYLDRETDQLIDHCQHVAMGCCTNYLDFCRRTEIADHFNRHKALHFFGPDGRRTDFRPCLWLPAPLHLVPSLLRLSYLSLGDKLAIARAMLTLIRGRATDPSDGPTVQAWLGEQRQPLLAVERFWQVVLVSALGESLERASLSAARKVFLDGFLAHPHASHLLVPRVPLGRLYDDGVAEWLKSRGVEIHLESPVELVTGGQLRLASGKIRPFDFLILAVPWRQAARLLSPEIRPQLPQVEAASQFASAPITSVHLWFDRPITELPHAVLVGRLSQWVFARAVGRGSLDPVHCSTENLQRMPEGNLRSEVSARSGDLCRTVEHYYQVVISASHDLAQRERTSVRDEVLADLQATFASARDARLLRWQMITEHEAVFSVRPGLTELRPPQATSVAGVFLAGDWTQTGWPATMEGAVRSGYLAAEAVLAHLGRPERILAPDLPRGWLLRMLGG